MDENFPKRLGDLIKERNLTQVEVAKRLQTGQSTISQWLAGSSTPRPKTVRQIAALFKVSPRWLTHGEEEPKKALYDFTPGPSSVVKEDEFVYNVKPEIWNGESMYEFMKEIGPEATADIARGALKRIGEATASGVPAALADVMLLARIFEYFSPLKS